MILNFYIKLSLFHIKLDDVLNQTDDHLKQFGITTNVPETTKKTLLVKLKELEIHIQDILSNHVDFAECLEELQDEAIQFVKENSKNTDFEKELKTGVRNLPSNIGVMMKIMLGIVSDFSEQLKVKFLSFYLGICFPKINNFMMN